MSRVASWWLSLAMNNPVDGAVWLMRMLTMSLFGLAFWMSLSVPASAQTVEVSPTTVCFGSPVTVTVTIACGGEAGAQVSAQIGEDAIAISYSNEDGDGNYVYTNTDTYVPSTAGTLTVSASDDCGDGTFYGSSLDVVILYGISVYNASPMGGMGPYDYDTSITTSGSVYVEIDANVYPADSNAAGLFSWSCGQRQSDPFEVWLPTTSAGETVETETCCGASDSANIWVIALGLESITFTNDHHVMTSIRMTIGISPTRHILRHGRLL